MDMRSFNISIQGASHIKKGKECQDSSYSYSDNKISVAIVCDGHGGDDYVRSAFGSKYACEVALENICSFLMKADKGELEKNHDKLIHQLEASIINNWNEKIYSHYEQNPFTESELSVISEKAKNKYLNEKSIESAYGTTLIAVAVTADYWFGIHIGDGKCVAVNSHGKFLQPIPWDDKCFLNATTSMCDSKALENFRHCYYAERLPVAVFVGSDGIDDCFMDNDQLAHLYKTILYSFATSDFNAAVNDLKDYLPRLSAKGSGDDVSIAAILDMDKIGELEAIKQFDREKEKSRIEENAKREAEKAEEERRRIEEEHNRAEEKRRLEEEKRLEAQRRKDDLKRRNIREKAEKYKQNHPDVFEDQPYARVCGKCGKMAEPTDKFCRHCGNKLFGDIKTQYINSPLGNFENNDKVEEDFLPDEQEQQVNVNAIVNNALQNEISVDDAEKRSETVSILEEDPCTADESICDKTEGDTVEHDKGSQDSAKQEQ